MNELLHFHRVTLSQDKVLRALATYKFLTTGQLLILKIMTDRANMNKQLAELKNRSRPLIGSITFGVHPTFGKLESIHYLTSHGVCLLLECYGEQFTVKYPKGSNQIFQQDYFHRINLITVQIELYSWASKNEVSVLLFRTYFDKLSSGKTKGFRAESAIEIHGDNYLIADALCLLKTKRREELYAIEMYNGDDTSRVHQSLFGHLQALKNGQPSRQFGLGYGSRVLCVFEKDIYKLKAMKRVAEDPRFVSSKVHFLFKSMEELQTDNFFDWWLFDGGKVGLF